MVMKEALGRVSGDERNRGFRERLGIAVVKTAIFLGGVKDPSKITIEAPVKVYPEITLEEETERLVGRFQELGFHQHKKIRMSRGKFKDSLMELVVPQPENFKGRLKTPFIGCGKIPIEDQCSLAGIDYVLKGLNVLDWPEDPQDYKTPDGFYLAWTDEGARFMNRKVIDVRQDLALDERGGTEFDGIALYIAKPQVLEKRFLDLPGTSVGSDGAAGLRLWHGRPGLRDYFVDDAYPRFGSLVCGRQK